MADLAVGLAKSVVEGTLSKAQAAITEEAKLRDSAQRDLVFITAEFEMMQSFLKVANSERVENAVVLTWVRQIRELAYDVEDCIEFVVHLDKKPSWWWRTVPGWMFSCCSWTPPSQLLDEAVDRIEQLKARVEDVSTRNARYSLISDTGSKPVVVVQPGAEAAASESSRAMLMGGARDGTGRRQQGDLATQLLTVTADADAKLRVISVWGAGVNLGVTSVIWKAYNDKQVSRIFACRAWVKLVHPFSSHDFVRGLADQFYANSCKAAVGGAGKNVGLDVFKRTTTGRLELEELEAQLNQKRYLVVLEDLSSMTDWDAISNFFPAANRNGSCIIVSTQQSEVASLCVGQPYQALDVTPFSPAFDHSVYAFYQPTSQSDDRDKGHKTDDDIASARSLPMIDSAHVLSRKKKAADHWIAEHHIVGRDAETDDLRRYATEVCFGGIQFMSVWGIAGVGKSSLVRNLFCDTIINDDSIFDKYAWVEVAYPFKLRDFSRSLLMNFHSESLETNETAENSGWAQRQDPIRGCSDTMRDHRCLVVIDGLKSTNEWDLIQTNLVPASSQNCIIAITTEVGIAEHCSGDSKYVFNVKGLEDDAAYDLFKNQVSAGGNPLPSQLSDVEVAELKELVSKCGGLAKVIVEIGFSIGSKTVEKMKSVRSLSCKFMHDLETTREFDKLQGLFSWVRTYFQDCPDSLKPCIFYLSIFPRDFLIRRRRLLRRWIAEGYSRDNHDDAAEQNGEKQFSALLDLSLIQQQRRKIATTTHSDTRKISYQVNGFIREYIVSRRMEENLVFELGTGSTVTTQRSGRHLVILHSWKRDKIVFESMDFSRLRSLTVFGDWESYFISESLRLLRVLDLENASGLKEDDLKKMVKVLLRLKFLSLRGHRDICRLPGPLHKLRQLQTLDVRGTSITILPKKITKLQKLQYIRAGLSSVDVKPPVSSSSCSALREFCRCHRPTAGVVVPIGIGKLTALHTLGVVDVAASGATAITEDLKQLTQLRKLGVSGINMKNSSKFFSAIKGHVHMESLSVHLEKDNRQGCCLRKDSNNQGFFDGLISLHYENLRSLKLYGLEDELPKWEADKLMMLTKLELEMSSLTDDGIEILGKLPELRILRANLLKKCELHFCLMVYEAEDDSFQKVKVLEISCSSSQFSVTFGSKTMKELELLKVDSPSASSEFKFSGMKNLQELKVVALVQGPNSATQKRHLDLQLEDHPNENKPVVNLE